MKLLREMRDPFRRKTEVAFQQMPDLDGGYEQRLGLHRCDSVAMIPVREHGRFRQHRAGGRALQNRGASVGLMAHQVHTPARHKEQCPDRVVTVKQVLAFCEGSFGDGLRPKIGDYSLRHDSYHVARKHGLAS